MPYLDNATRVKPDADLIKEMASLYQDSYASALSPYLLGQQNVSLANEAFEQIKSLLGANSKDRLIYSSSRPQAINAVIWSTFFEITKEYGKNHYLSTQIEEAPQLFSLTKLEEMGCVSNLLSVDSKGTLTKETLTEGLTPRTALLTLSLVNGLTGTIQPLEEISELCKERGVLLHLDLTHALGKVEIDLKNSGVDFATFSGETIGALPSSCCLYVREGLPFNAPTFGAEPSSLGVVDAAQLNLLAKALKRALEESSQLQLEGTRLRSAFEEMITDGEVLFKAARNSTTSVIAFPGVTSEALLFALTQEGVMASIGGGLFQQIGHLLEATHHEPSISNCAVSFSLSKHTTDEEIEEAATIVNNCVSRLKPLSQECQC